MGALPHAREQYGCRMVTIVNTLRGQMYGCPLSLRDPETSSMVETVHQEGHVKLSIETRQPRQRETVLTLSGEVDYESAQDLRSAVTRALDGRIDSLIINLAGVTFLDSTGIGTLVVARRICHGCGVTMHIREANPFIVRLFAVVGVCDVLGVPLPAGAVASARLPKPRERSASTAM
jgi:anti-sigma B factor antagonist